MFFSPDILIVFFFFFFFFFFRLYIVFFIMVIHGVGILMPWNMLINAQAVSLTI
jgi:hypothetical protein